MYFWFPLLQWSHLVVQEVSRFGFTSTTGFYVFNDAKCHFAFYCSFSLLSCSMQVFWSYKELIHSLLGLVFQCKFSTIFFHFLSDAIRFIVSLFSMFNLFLILMCSASKIPVSMYKTSLEVDTGAIRTPLIMLSRILLISLFSFIVGFLVYPL